MADAKNRWLLFKNLPNDDKTVEEKARESRKAECEKRVLTATDQLGQPISHNLNYGNVAIALFPFNERSVFLASHVVQFTNSPLRGFGGTNAFVPRKELQAVLKHRIKENVALFGKTIERNSIDQVRQRNEDFKRCSTTCFLTKKSLRVKRNVELSTGESLDFFCDLTAVLDY
jgi:hypothetical protein